MRYKLVIKNASFPQSKIVQQQGTDGGLRLKVLDSIDEIDEKHPLWGIRDLLEQLEDCKDGVNVLPASIKVSTPALVDKWND